MARRGTIARNKTLLNQDRYYFIDVLRIIACFLVIVNHTNSVIFTKSTPEALTWWASLTYFFISKPAVPLFVMISGFTLLDKKDNYTKSLVRILRILVVLVLFSFVYYLHNYFDGKIPSIDIVGFFRSIYSKNITNAFWYLYLYLGILIMLPFLQKAVSAFSKKDVRLFILISLAAFSLYPILIFYFPALSVSKYFQLDLFGSYICLLLMGYYFKKYVSIKTSNLLVAIVVYVATLAFNVYATYCLYCANGGKTYLFFDNRALLPIVLQAASLFYIVMHLCRNKKVGRVLPAIGGCTFGIYLLSDLLIARLKFIDKTLVAQGIHPLLSIVAFELLVFIVGLCVIYLVRLIPFVKKYI